MIMQAFVADFAFWLGFAVIIVIALWALSKWEERCLREMQDDLTSDGFDDEGRAG